MNGVLDAFRPLYRPRAVAVAGASATGTTLGNRFLRLLRQHGYDGAVYPIHPGAETVEGFPAWRSIAEAPTPVDYAYLTVPAGRVADVLEPAAGRLAFAQVMAAAEGEEGAAFEAQLKDIARRTGIRIIGPNCMGTHSPAGRVTFMEGALVEPGGVGIVSQSGGLGMDILRRGQNLGLRFSGLVSIGNSVDVGPADLLEYHLADPETRVVGLYLEDVKDGRRFQTLLRENRGRKPVVLLVGGLTGQGRSAAASHTGALAGSGRAWDALSRQTGAILTDTLDAFLDALQTCLWLAPKPHRDAPAVTLYGNGGGTSVLATDTLDRAGFGLARATPAALEAFAALKLPPGASLKNPIDLPASVLQGEEGRVTGRILDVVRREIRPHAILVHVNLPVVLGYRHVENFVPNLVDAVLGAAPQGDGDPHLLVAVRSDRSEEADEWRRRIRAQAGAGGVPTFDEIPQAVAALARYAGYERFLARRGAAAGTGDAQAKEAAWA